MGPAVLPANRLSSRLSFERITLNPALLPVPFYDRRLPHWHPDGRDIFITWRLHGSLPPTRYVPPDGLTTGQAFAWIDRYLDRATYGPTWMLRPGIAQIMADALHYGQDSLRHYALHAYVVMANHVHVLLTPFAPLAKVTLSLKGYTAREANLILNRTGKPFWQSESYDHWLREGEFDRIKGYIEFNPVRAGLVKTAEEYPWSSAVRKAGTNAGLQPGLAAPPS